MFSFFNNPNNNNTCHNMSNDNFDLLQKARQDLVGEIQAIIEYDSHLHSTNDKLAKQTWLSIRNEELTHVGELLALLNYLDSSQMKFVEDGINEFNKNLNHT